MANIEQIASFCVNRFDASLAFYKDTKNAYNEHSCRIEYIDPFFETVRLGMVRTKKAWRLSMRSCCRTILRVRTVQIIQ